MRPGATRLRAALAALVWLVCIGPMPGAALALPETRFSVLAQTGDVGSRGGVLLGPVGIPSLGPDGVYFQADVLHPDDPNRVESSLLHATGDALVELVRSGDQVPGADARFRFVDSWMGTAAPGRDGHVLFTGRWTEDGETRSGAFLANGERIEPFHPRGTPVPDDSAVSAGSRFGRSNGDLFATSADLLDPESEDRIGRALWLGPPGALRPVVRDGDPIVGGGRIGAPRLGTLTPGGAIWFFATRAEEPEPDWNLYRWSGGAIEEVVRNGARLPDGRTLHPSQTMAANDHDDVVFRGFARSAEGYRVGLFASLDGVLQSVALTDDVVDERPWGLGGFLDPSTPADSGDVAFFALGLQGREEDEGLYLLKDGELLTVARRTLPLDREGLFLWITRPTMNRHGLLAFSASITGPGGLARVLHAFDGENLIEILRERDELLGSPVQWFARSELDDAGRIAIGFTLEDGRSGIALGLVSAPTATSALALALLALAITRRRRRS